MQLSRYSLCTMDILLRSLVTDTSIRGALVDMLSEEALVGGNLIRLRLRPPFSPTWLLAWLRGPGGDQLYVNGKLQKQMLQQYLVPIPKQPEELQHKLLLFFTLEEKAAVALREKRENFADNQLVFFLRFPCSSRMRFSPVLSCWFGMYSSSSDRSQPKASQILSNWSKLIRSAISLYKSPIVDLRILIISASFVCVHRRSPRILDR